MASLKRWFLGVWTIIGIVILLAALWRVIGEPISIILPPLGLALVIVYLLNPVVTALENRGVPRLMGTLAAYVTLLGVLALGIALAGRTLADQVTSFGDQIPDIATAVTNWVNAQLRRFNIAEVQNLDTASLQERVTEYVTANRDQLLGLLQGAGDVAVRVFHILLTLILGPVLALYALVDLPRLSEQLRRLVPPGPRAEVLDVARRIGLTVGAYFRGQLMVATFVATATAVGLAILGLPFWALVGVLTGVFNLVPLIGPFVGGAIGVIIALSVGDGVTQALLVVAIMAAVQQVDNHLISPMIVSRTVKIHPITVMMGLLVAGSMFGILGMLVVIPVIAATKLLFLAVVVTRVPALSHLAEHGPGLFDDQDGDGVAEADEREDAAARDA